MQCGAVSQCGPDQYCDPLLHLCAECILRCRATDNHHELEECKNLCPEMYERMYVFPASSSVVVPYSVDTTAATSLAPAAMNTHSVVGIILGCVFVLSIIALIAALVVYLKIRRTKKRSEPDEEIPLGPMSDMQRSPDGPDLDSSNTPLIHHHDYSVSTGPNHDRRHSNDDDENLSNTQKELTKRTAADSNSINAIQCEEQEEGQHSLIAFSNEGNQLSSYSSATPMRTDHHDHLLSINMPSDSRNDSQPSSYSHSKMTPSSAVELNSNTVSQVREPSQRIPSLERQRLPSQDDHSMLVTNTSPCVDSPLSLHLSEREPGEQTPVILSEAQATLTDLSIHSKSPPMNRENTVTSMMSRSSSGGVSGVMELDLRETSPESENVIPRPVFRAAESVEDDRPNREKQWQMVLKMYDEVDGQMHNLPFIAGCMIGSDALQVFVKTAADLDIDECYDRIRNILPKDPIVQDLLIVQPESETASNQHSGSNMSSRSNSQAVLS